MPRNPLVPLLALFLVVFAVAAAGFVATRVASPGSSGGSGLTVATRLLRDDSATGVEVRSGSVPAALEQMLNAGVTNPSDRVSLPVHPEGRLIGSTHLHQPDGTDLVWLMYDVEGDLSAIAQTVSDQLSQSPWQVTAGRGGDLERVVRFHSSRTGDLEGTAILTLLPSANSYRLTVMRGGSETTMTVRITAVVPSIGGTRPDLTIERVEAGPVQEAGLRRGDRIVRVNDTAVKTPTELAGALRAASTSGSRRTALTYIVRSAVPEAQAAQPPFLLPQQPLALPATFPARPVWQGLTVIGYQWEQAQGQRAYQAALVTRDASAAVGAKLRDGLKAGGWEITGDQPQGFATQLQIQHPREGLVGRVVIDQLEQDQAYLQVLVQIQSQQMQSQGGPGSGRP